MKLRNKKTGEIIEWEKSISYKLGKEYNSLAELNTEWEDYEEPDGIKSIEARYRRGGCKIIIEYSSEEETRDAYDKICAWKRLRNKEFKFNNCDVSYNGLGYLCGRVFYKAGKYSIGDIKKDLDLLFGGEE